MELEKDKVIEAVRKNLDEQGSNESLMYTEDNKDNESLDSLIWATLAEAINEVNLTAPVELLEGSDATILNESVDNKILSFSISESFLRLVKFQSIDSDFILTDVTAESSVEGRKQLNKYTRGTFDRPSLVIKQGNNTTPSFVYYSLKEETTQSGSKVKEMSVVQVAKASDTTFSINRRLCQSVIDRLTGLVLGIYGMNDKAKYFFDKSQIYYNS